MRAIQLLLQDPYLARRFESVHNGHIAIHEDHIVATLSLTGSPSLKDRFEKNEPQLRDTACSAMATKTISEMEKPGFRNTLRAELVALFNGVMGKGTVSEIYLTDFAIQ